MVAYSSRRFMCHDFTGGHTPPIALPKQVPLHPGRYASFSPVTYKSFVPVVSLPTDIEGGLPKVVSSGTRGVQ